jgi:hypothetical protein
VYSLRRYSRFSCFAQSRQRINGLTFLRIPTRKDEDPVQCSGQFFVHCGEEAREDKGMSVCAMLWQWGSVRSYEIVPHAGSENVWVTLGARGTFYFILFYFIFMDLCSTPLTHHGGCLFVLSSSFCFPICLPPRPPLRMMGRPTWATPEQAAFLEEFVPRLEEEKYNLGLKPFYAQITKQFIERWPSPLIPDEETDKDELKRSADDRRGRVSQCVHTLLNVR